MNKVFALVFFLSSFSLFSKDLKSPPIYRIISSLVDESIPAGKVKVSGTIFYGYNDAREPIINACFTDGSGQVICASDMDGKFQFTREAELLKKLTITYPGFDKLEIVDLKFKEKTHYTIEIYFPEQYDVVLKPVIYAYSEQPKAIKFDLQFHGNLSFTYPQLDKNTWNVTTQEDGTLQDSRGNNYPYLFWEGTSEAQLQFDKLGRKEWYGNFVLKDSIVSFLERSLTALNLNDKEKTDFITFWGPRMVQHEKVFVQFLVDDAYDKIATLEVSPKPDHIRRIYLLYQGVAKDKSFEYAAQGFHSFDRKGFTVVEWGGSELLSNEL